MVCQTCCHGPVTQSAQPRRRTPAGYPRTRKLLELVRPIGDLVLAQLLFAGCCLTVVLMVPAAVALQRTAEAILVEEETAILRTFGRHFARAVRRYAVVGLAVQLVAAGLVISGFFWAAADGPLRIAALVVLTGVGGFLLGCYLAALAELGSGADTAVRPLIGAALRRVNRQPLHVAGCLVIMITWLLLLLRLPTLALIGTGLVPALLAFWLRYPRGVTSRSPQ